MQAAMLEHVNVTVSDPVKTAEMLETLFGWKTRWHGNTPSGGTSYHVGTEDTYVAVYSPPEQTLAPETNYGRRGGLNHIAVVVDDLDTTEDRVKSMGFVPMNHGDYEPGRRFYFRDHDGIEFEVVSY